MKYCLAVRTVTHHEPFLPVTSGRALLAFTLFVGSGAVLADEPAEKRWSISATVVSDYRFRGISQSWRESALQGGVEYGHPSGWYGGLWSSQISGNVYPGAQFEVDLYGGYKGSVSNGIGYNAGLLQYKYPGGRYRPAAGIAPQRFDTLEANFDVSYRSFGLKYSHALSDYFGVNSTSATSPAFCADSSPASPCAPGVVTLPARGSSRGSSYLELYGSIELGDGVTLGLHAGRQVVRNYESLGFRDYRVSLGKELAGVHAHPRLHEHDRR